MRNFTHGRRSNRRSRESVRRRKRGGICENGGRGRGHVEFLIKVSVLVIAMMEFVCGEISCTVPLLSSCFISLSVLLIPLHILTIFPLNFSPTRYCGRDSSFISSTRQRRLIGTVQIPCPEREGGGDGQRRWMRMIGC